METDQDNGTNISNTGAEGKATKRTQKQAKDTHETEMESSLTHAKEGGGTDANGKPTDFTTNQGDDTPDNILSADAASNKDTNTGTEEDTSERTQKQGERLDSSVTPAKQEGDTVAHGEPNTITPNQGADTATENTFAEKTSKQAGVAKGESTELPANQGDSTQDNKLTAGAASNEDDDTFAERKSAERTSKQAGGTDANGKPSELTPTQGDDTPDNILSADAASNKDTEQGAEEDTTDRTQKQGEILDSSVTPAKQEGDTVANGVATKITPHQSCDKGTRETPKDLKPNQEDCTPDIKCATDAVSNEGDGLPDDKCTTDAASNEANEKGGEPTEPILSKGGTMTDVKIFPDAKVAKGVNASKYLEESPQAKDENPDFTQTMQSVIDTNEALLSEIVQLKQEIEAIANQRDEKDKGIADLGRKDIENQTNIFELREELKAWQKKYKDAMKERNAKINEIEKYKEAMKERNAKIKEIEKEYIKYSKKDAENERYKKSVQKRINSMSIEIIEREDNIKKQNDEIKKLNGTMKQVETQRQKYENESKLEIQTLNKNIAKLNAHIKEIESKHNTEVINLNRDINAERQNRFALSRKYNDLVQRLHTVEGERHSLTEEKKELLLRLSKVAGANLTYNNPNIADLSDEKRPTKLAEEFSELYDNEWTDVFEELDFETEKGKTNFMLDILKKTNAICSDLSNGHTKRIKDAFCRLTTTSHNTLANVVKQSRLETMEVVPTYLQKETKVKSVDNDMDLVKEGNNVNNESHDDDEQIDQALNNKFELEETIEKQDKTDSGTVTESIEMSGQRRENDLEQVREAKRESIEQGHEENKLSLAEPPKDESLAGYSNTLNAGKKEGNNDNNDEKSVLEHSNTDDNPEENKDETGVETPEAPIDESIEGHLNTENADQNKCKANKDKKDEIPEAKHDSKDKGHEEKEEEKNEPPKDESTTGNLNTLSPDKTESKAYKDKNDEKSKLEQDNMDNNPVENKDGTEVETSKPTIQDAANENANELQSNRTSEHEHDNTAKQLEENKDENQVETPGSPIKDKTDSDTLEAPEATRSSMDDVTETPTEISIESDFELLRKEQKKTIMDAKIFFENELAKEVETTVAAVIGKEFKTDTENKYLMDYIMKCVNICWSMFRHNPPVFIEFPAIKETVPFDTNKYKPYTSSGKFIDYIVWPALHLHEGGPLLCKGVAQGLGNKNTK